MSKSILGVVHRLASKLTQSWGRRTLVRAVVSILVTLAIVLLLPSTMRDAIQAAGLMLLIVVTFGYAASSKRMADEAERTRLERRIEKKERENAAVSDLRYEAEQNLEIWEYLADQRTEACQTAPLLSFSAYGKGQVKSVARLLGTTADKLRRAYFAMDCVNVKITEYFGSLGKPGNVRQLIRSYVFSEMRRLGQSIANGKEPVNAPFLKEMIKELGGLESRVSHEVHALESEGPRASGAAGTSAQGR